VWNELRDDLTKQSELTSYYKKIAEEERTKSLGMEREIALQ
jgi:hypothetical protein